MKEFTWGSLHFVTRLILVAMALRLAGDLIQTWQALGKVQIGAATYGEFFPAEFHAYGYSLIFVGSAATVELLYRIWRELRQLRLSGIEPAAPDAEDPTSA
jgi:hypothetical protein